MPVVKMPDGALVRFPDDMPKEQIKGMIASKFPEVSAPQQPQEESYSGSILPLTRDKDGIHFDSDAGFIGSIKRALTLPGDVYSGKVDVGSEEAIKRSLELGGMASPVGALGKVKPNFATMTRTKAPKVKVPAAAELKEAYKLTADEIKDEGIEYSLDAAKELSRRIQERLASEAAIGDELAPTTFKILRKLENPPKGARSVPFSTGLNTVNKQLGRLGSGFSSTNPADPVAANWARRNIMEFLERPPEGSIVSGKNPGTVGPRIKEANANYAAAKRAEMLRGVEDSAELRAAAANSGKNIGNTIRQRVAGLLLNKGSARDRAGFTEKELQQIEKIARGSIPANVTRDLGNLLGGGGGLGGLLSAGAGGTVGTIAGGPMGGVLGTAATMAAGRGAKSASNLMTRKALNKVEQETLKRSPLYQQRLTNAPRKQITYDAKEALVKQFLMELVASERERNHSYANPMLD